MLVNAVCPSAAILDGSGTLPVCFKSYDVFTLEAAASLNSPAGAEWASRGYREVVSVSPPTPLRLSCESQYDFNQMMSLLSTALRDDLPALALPGYPYGNRVVSYPNVETRPADVARIRAEIEDDVKRPRRVITVRGEGYVFAKAKE